MRKGGWRGISAGFGGSKWGPGRPGGRWGGWKGGRAGRERRGAALGALGAALLFGFADALQFTLSVLNVPIPSDVLSMFPYLATILAVAGLVGRVVPPAADGQAYVRD